MNWINDNSGLKDGDLGQVFKYREDQSTVVRVSARSKEALVWNLTGESEWNCWLQDECPSIDRDFGPGLVFVIAKRIHEPLAILNTNGTWKIPLTEWVEHNLTPERRITHRALTFETIAEKTRHMGSSKDVPIMSGQRSVRSLPFSQKVFRSLTAKFHTPGSIASVISRADIPVFSSSQVRMEDEHGGDHPAYVYNCRTSNAWEMDLALSATYFPEHGLTFAIIFGCPLQVEQEILTRVSASLAECEHPMILPGILAELERTRHVNFIEAVIDEIETKIFQLDFTRKDMEGLPDAETEIRNQQKRSAWLDTTYLRNGLITWSRQLGKMARHAEEVDLTVMTGHLTPHADHLSRVQKPSNSGYQGNGTAYDDVLIEQSQLYSGSRTTNEKMLSTSPEVPVEGKIHPYAEIGTPMMYPPRASPHLTMALSEPSSVSISGSEVFQSMSQDHSNDAANINERSDELAGPFLRRVGLRIHDRIQDIIDEYDDKIRDCTMRIEGMAMATQWAYGETNVQIAIGTNRDSKLMRSIAFVTMFFLPGTFLASVFSMGFFKWDGDSGSVSSYLWIYFLTVFILTLVTVGLWWYFIQYRPSRHQRAATCQEEAV